MTTTTHSLDLDNLTVIAFDEGGEGWDLNAGGEPCADLAELRAFVTELERQGFYGVDVRDELLAQIPADMAVVGEDEALTIVRGADGRGVRDISGGIWWPHDEDPSESDDALIGRCHEQPMTGRWSS